MAQIADVVSPATTIVGQWYDWYSSAPAASTVVLLSQSGH